jgi:hypothetical protein
LMRKKESSYLSLRENLEQNRFTWNDLWKCVWNCG